MADNPNLEFGNELVPKALLYELGLTFGVLALAVQTARFDQSLPGRIAELVGWASLLIAGLGGVSALRWLPSVFQITGLQGETEHRLHQFRTDQVQGIRTVHVTEVSRDRPIEEIIATAVRDLDSLKTRLREVEKGQRRRNRIQRVGLLLGLVALMVSRGLDPLLAILRDLGIATPAQ